MFPLPNSWGCAATMAGSFDVLDAYYWAASEARPMGGKGRLREDIGAEMVDDVIRRILTFGRDVVQFQVVQPLAARSQIPRLAMRSRTENSRVTGEPNNPVVSLTTYGARLRTVHHTIESIAQGSVRPSRLILWVNEPRILEDPGAHLRRLRNRGLEIRLAADYGPHTKYFPYAASAEPHSNHPLVTADDDIIYAPYWLRGLRDNYDRRQELIHCWRARTITLNDSGIMPYAEWLPCSTTTATNLAFSTGVSGVIYPPRMLIAIREYGTEFMDRSQNADDVWLNWIALRSGIRVRQVRPRPKHFASLRSTQRVRLSKSNVDRGRNDRYVANVYTSSDIESLLAARESLAGRST